MSIGVRARIALGAAFKHFWLSLLVAAVAAALVLGLWYPSPYGKLSGGFALFGLLVIVDVICGPLLTLVVFDLRKPRSELIRDIGIIVLIQVAALVYGFYSIAQARPIFLAYEGNRFRVVSMADIQVDELPRALPALRKISYIGPRLVGVKLLETDDAEYRDSIMLSMQGIHPAFRPERWVHYESQLVDLQAALRSISVLKTKHPIAIDSINEVLSRHDLTEQNAGYLPLTASKAHPSDWVVIVERSSGLPRAYLPLDGW
ncbi:MAG: TfpX/TfpZ family type IV pilin accessory protein [Pseudomonadota bacterium]|nr:TfpX/TfpZ family type IV pilin accessory protein [Pseudomonadota bacterium]